LSVTTRTPRAAEQALRDSETKAHELRRTAAMQVAATSEPLVERFEVAVLTEIRQPAPV
jgi:hypothetical protein